MPIADFVLDRHLLAAISIAGAVCDLMGGLFLAYDLLGGSHGPLRTLTRVVTYTLFFCLGYGLPLSLVIEPPQATAAYQTNSRPRIRMRELLASAFRGTATALACWPRCSHLNT
jgi:hypothetical protein